MPRSALVFLLFAAQAEAVSVGESIRKTLAAKSLAAAGLPDPHCATGILSLKEGEDPQVCCAGYCGECSDYPTCKSVRKQDSENACCKTAVYKMRCGGGAAANECLKPCSEAVPPCIMDNKVYKAPNPENRTAGSDCNEAVKDWRLKAAEGTGEDGLTPFLPEPRHGTQMTLVLDLDETLMHCQKRGIPDEQPDMCLHFTDSGSTGYVRFRPYAVEMLEVLATWGLCEVVVFTASTQAYADTVLDTLDPNKKWITHRLYRPSCTLSPSGGYFKDLSLLGRPLDKVILVDNSPTSLAMQPDNGIPVRTWQDDMKDREMIDLISVLHSCRSAPNVRSFLKQAYRFEEFLEKLRYQDAETAALLQRYGEL